MRMRIYVIQMLGRIPDEDGQVMRLLSNYKAKERDSEIKNHIDESIRCLRAPNGCPDLYRESGH